MRLWLDLWMNAAIAPTGHVVVWVAAMGMVQVSNSVLEAYIVIVK